MVIEEDGAKLVARPEAQAEGRILVAGGLFPLEVCRREGFPQVVPGHADAVAIGLVDTPTPLGAGVQVPQEPLEPVLQDRRRSRRAPDPVRLRRAVVDGAEVRVEPRHVIHVEVREAELIDGARLPRGQFRDAPLAAIEEEPLGCLAAVDADVERVVPAGAADQMPGEAQPRLRFSPGRRATSAAV